MAELKNYHFYYGAILGAIFQYNEDASPALVLNDNENRQVYKILTNTSKQECIAFFKYARQPKMITKNEAYSSWLFSFSQEFGLNPIILQEQPSQGMTIIEKFEKYAKTCSYAFTIFTPDDIVENNGEKYFQARPNVIFELGWFYAHLGRSKVCVLDQESNKSEIFSDLQGVLRLQFKSDVNEKMMDIRKELKASNIID